MIDNIAFIKRLNQTTTLSFKLSNAISDGFRLNRYQAQETFLSPGNQPYGIFYIQSGIVGGSVETGNEKNMSWIKSEGDLIIPQSIFTLGQSDEYISALTNITLISLPYVYLQKLAEAHPEIDKLLIVLLTEQANEGHYREKLLRIPTAKDRYNFFLNHEGALLNRIPHFQIASYLNITKETFSRVQKG